MPLLVATRSDDKLRELRGLLGGIELLSLHEAGIPESPEEDAIEGFDTFPENALAKARYFHGRSGMPTLADDSGICIDALGGAPGVRSRRFALDDGAELRGRELDEANNALLLTKLSSVPDPRRTAHYTCAAAYIDGAGRAFLALGTCAGRILAERRGKEGFGYDPLFVPDGDERSFGEMGAAEKHALSHRGRAFRPLAAWLRRLPGD